MTRVTIRLKRSLPEDVEIEAVLPDSLEEIEAKLAEAGVTLPLDRGARTGNMEAT